MAGIVRRWSSGCRQLPSSAARPRRPRAPRRPACPPGSDHPRRRRLIGSQSAVTVPAANLRAEEVLSRSYYRDSRQISWSQEWMVVSMLSCQEPTTETARRAVDRPDERLQRRGERSAGRAADAVPAPVSGLGSHGRLPWPGRVRPDSADAARSGRDRLYTQSQCSSPAGDRRDRPAPPDRGRLRENVSTTHSGGEPEASKGKDIGTDDGFAPARAHPPAGALWRASANRSRHDRFPEQQRPRCLRVSLSPRPNGSVHGNRLDHFAQVPVTAQPWR